MRCFFRVLILTIPILALFSCTQEELLKVQIETSIGNITVQLNPQKAPQTVTNFLAYVRDGFYEGTIFHRVIKGFMIQGGGMTQAMQSKSTHPPIQNEADNGLKNKTGTIAMARTSAPHSATSQFFINTADNAFLDHTAKTPQGWGYCVFGRVTQGMQVVRAIENIKTGSMAGHRDVPTTPVLIQRVRVIRTAADATSENPPPAD